MLQFSIITISTFVGILNEVVKFIGVLCKKDVSKILPILSLVFGVALGVAGYYTPNVEMGQNLIEAIFIGLSAGAAATGIHQIGKQLYKDTTTTEVPTIDLSQFIKDQTDVIDDEEDVEVSEYTEGEEPTETPIEEESVDDDTPWEGSAPDLPSEPSEEAIEDLDDGADNVEETK